MSTAQSKAVSTHRSRQQKRGIVRVEVQVPECDAPLIREIASALRDPPERAGRTRVRLQGALTPELAKTLLEMLSCDLPDDVVDEALARPLDLGRDVEP